MSQAALSLYEEEETVSERVAVEATGLRSMAPDIDAKFLAKVRVTSDGHQEWLGAKAPSNGDPLFSVYIKGCYVGRVRGHMLYVRAHRYAWKRLGRSIPSGMLLLPTCDHPGCINPDHRQLVPVAEALQTTDYQLSRIGPREDRAYQLIAPPNADRCRFWLGSINRAGYGVIQNKLRDPNKAGSTLAHVLLWELENGRRLPDGAALWNRCGHKHCVELSHWDFIPDQKQRNALLAEAGKAAQLKRGPFVGPPRPQNGRIRQHSITPSENANLRAEQEARIRSELTANPNRTNSSIALACGVTTAPVTRIRSLMVAAGEIPDLEYVTLPDGRTRPLRCHQPLNTESETYQRIKDALIAEPGACSRRIAKRLQVSEGQTLAIRQLLQSEGILRPARTYRPTGQLRPRICDEKVRAELHSNPDRSDTAIAALCGTNNTRVRKIRLQLVEAGEIPDLEYVTLADGRKRPLRKAEQKPKGAPNA